MATSNDAQLQAMLEADLLQDDRVSSQKITLDVRAGNATLRGSVSSFRRKLVAQQIVTASEGINSVDNQLVVEPEESVDDERIIADVRAALDASADIAKEAVAVSVELGKVTLNGNVRSHWERSVAEDIVRGVRGVRDVVNMLMPDPRKQQRDCDLIERVHRALSRARGLTDAGISVAIGDTAVVLSGTVTEQWRREAAESIVRSFGLIHIRNDIRVSGA